MELNMNPDDLIWNDTEYKLKFILDNPNFELPQIVRVLQGHMVDEDDALASGQVLTIHGKKKIENIIGQDVYSKEVSIPTSCPYKIKLISSGEPRKFQGVKELCFCQYPPEYVTLEDALVIGSDDEQIGRDVILNLKDQVVTNEGDVVGLNCIVNEEKKEKKIITLPIQYVGGFVESLSYDVMQKRYVISDLIKEHPLPLNIQFLPSNEKSCAYGPQLGVLKLEKRLSINSILATTIIENVRHALTFSADLPVTIQVATGIKKNKYALSDAQQPNIDLKRFDYCVTSDPYSGVTMQTFDELHTPMLPRRDSQKSRQYCSSTNSVNRYHSSLALTKKPDKNQNGNVPLKRNKSLDLGKDLKDIENFFKSKLGFKSIRKSMSKLTKEKSEKRYMQSVDIDIDDNQTFVTSDDGQSSTADICSIGVTSNGSGSTCNESYRIADCMDAMSLDNQSVTHSSSRRHSRKGSGDSGICVSGRKNRPRSRSRSRSRLSPDTPSSNPSDTCDSISEWSLPINLKDSPSSGRKTYASSQGGGSCNFLWSASDTNVITNGKSEQKEQYEADYLNNQNNFNLINFQNTQNNSNFEVETSCNVKEISPLTTKQLASMDEIRLLNEDGVGQILEVLQLNEFKDIFIENQVNGELLLDLEQDDLVNELRLSLFQAKKIIKYIKGWRPEPEHFQPTEASRRNSLNPRDWSENDVLLHMTTINLTEFGHFCRMSQVNGDLLLDILDKETLASVKKDHHVKISNLESKKLLNFVVKGWRPDISPKKSAIL